MTRNLFFGAGGLTGDSGDGGSTPTQTEDTLRSRDRVEVIIGLCKGPIKGFTNGDRSFYIGSTPLQATDGTYNFEEFSLELFPGTTPANQIVPVLGGFEDYRPFASPLAMPFNNSVQALTATVAGMTQIICRFNVLKLYKYGTDAQLAAIPGAAATASNYLPSSLQITINLSSDGGATYFNPLNGPTTITGRTRVGELHEIRMPVPGPGPYIIQCTCNTYDDEVYAPCQVQWLGFYEVTGGMFGQTKTDDIETQLQTGVPIIRTTQPPPQRTDGTTGIDYLCLRIIVQQLYVQNDSGVFEGLVQLKIESKQSSTGSYQVQLGGVQDIYGKTTTGEVIFEYRFPVARTTDTYDIRLTMVNPDNSTLFRTVVWESIQEIVGGPIQFDGLACIQALAQSTNQFSSIPQFASEIDGKLCRIPSNYDPYARVYAGAWDGTFKIDWTSNPAWILYDIAMDTTDGVRRYQPNFTIDPYDVYDAGVFCDAFVPDGQGGSQPRYTFNGVIDQPRGVREQLRYVSGIFGGVLVDDLNGSVRLYVDAYSDAVALFTYENIEQTGFQYTYTDPQTQYNDIKVTFNDPNLFYTPNQRRLYELDLQVRNGVVPLEMIAVGCTNVHEAVRRAALQMISATTEMEIVSFKTNRQGLMIRLLDTILVGDPDMGNSLTGRIHGINAARDVITVRDVVYLELGVIYYFNTQMPNPAYPSGSNDPTVLVRIPFAAPIAGAVNAFQINSALPPGVPDNAQFAIGSEGNDVGVPKPYRVTSIEYGEGDPDMITITGIEINRNKQLLADHASELGGFSFIGFPTDLLPPTALSIDSETALINGLLISTVTLSWKASLDPRVQTYAGQYKVEGDLNWTPIAETNSTHMEVLEVANGIYDFRVQGKGFGLTTQWIEVDGKAAGIDIPPDNVTGMVGNPSGNNLNISWNPVKAANLAYYWMRYSPINDGSAVWEAASDLIPQVSSVNVQVPAAAGTYFVKAVNVFGVASLVAAYIDVGESLKGYLLVEAVEQSPLWTGTRFNMDADGSGSLLVEIANGSTGYYSWASEDFGEEYTALITLAMVAAADNPAYVMASWPNLASVNPLSGVNPASFEFDVYIATLDNNLVFSPFKPFVQGEWTGRQFALVVYCNAFVPGIIPELQRLKALISLPAKTTQGNNVLVPTEGITILFDSPFHVPPTIVVTNKSQQAGDYYSFTSDNIYGFTVQFFDTNGAPAERIMDWAALGYGGRAT